MLHALLASFAWRPQPMAMHLGTRRAALVTTAAGFASVTMGGAGPARAAGYVDETVSLGGQQIAARRYLEADVGMRFPKTALDDKLFSKPWPEAWPFPPEAFRRQDETDDGDFYSTPRLVYHIDEGAVRALTHYYKENIKPGSAILDICSSWVSHYPTDFPQTMSKISGSGMNAFELQANKQLSDFSPKDLNVEPSLPFQDGQFDVVTCVVSVDYLNKPQQIFKEVQRVLKPGGKFILSQSNRCFPTKAIAMWLGMSDYQHCVVIGAYFHYCGGWTPPRAFDVSPTGPNTNDPLFIVEATKL
mmetsp:Transcript_51997/g.111168  ORF Transcript_51997/g.111168 Transcript_51997/m.111168 type:complete len:302 (-) Transcript_51997:278-1183(-)|eukprot:CAMPEP_0183351650 /NCGR_PEP_ID=MMETSP0164_2-20130417/26169_1 /TAXON_ID=221442 /ORGANISM="Coccolithus pelagicus ssp braarudi, Strain PLY182g" /LENGTH=301 /DNA_ID=CAMNT_0025523889 /DNA_START=22 /DNA_END=927 /DNA_ORIENTATION=+